MRCGLYGKLPVKRDFIAESVPRGFLPAFEPWLQGAVGTSRMLMGSQWQDIYLNAPIWRFWLGTSHCGQSVAGAFMPSIDGVGRFFPLVLMAMSDDGYVIPSPVSDQQSDWFDQVETYLLSTLEETTAFDTTIEALNALPPPRQMPVPPVLPGVVARPDGTLIVSSHTNDVAETFAQLRSGDDAGLIASATFWWTIGGNEVQPTALTCRRFPDPQLFSGFLTGRFDTL